MTLTVVVPPPQRLGAVPHGTRIIAPISSGTFAGPRLRGKVLAGGGDWTLLRSDGVLELDLRITLETDDGASISMSSSDSVMAAGSVGRSGARRVSRPFQVLLPDRRKVRNERAAVCILEPSDRDRIRRSPPDGPIYTVEEVL